MIKNYLHKIKRGFENKAIVLMYHRIAEPLSDVWNISVSPQNFDAQLKVLKKSFNVLSLPELAADVQKRKVRPKSIAITFDDGYADNFLAARPLLEKYHLPATFFIASGYIDCNDGFWWDTLETAILHTDNLPHFLTIELNEKVYTFSLQKETKMNDVLQYKHQQWKAGLETPPTRRAHIYYTIWEQLKTMQHEELISKLRIIKKWAAMSLTDDLNDGSMSLDQLEQLSRNPLFDIGAHTVTHPALTFHEKDFQEKEIKENKFYLEQLLKKDVSLLAYPFGIYNNDSIEAAKNCKIEAAFTTEEKPVYSNSKLLQLPRYQVKNWDEYSFIVQIQFWKSHI